MTLARRTSVIIPAFNEEHAVGPIVTGLQGAAEWLEILVVDDGSSDEHGGTGGGGRRACGLPSVQQRERRGGQDRDPPGRRGHSC